MGQPGHSFRETNVTRADVTPGDPEVRDEVCGMQSTASTARATAEFQGKTYYFCGEHCRRRFLEHPGWYVLTRP